MKTLHLQIEDDFYDEFIKTLPADKIKILDQRFIDNQNKLTKELESFKTSSITFKPHLENMKALDNWLKEAEDNGNS